MWKTGKNGIDTWGSSSINKKEEIFKNNLSKKYFKKSFMYIAKVSTSDYFGKDKCVVTKLMCF